MHALVEGVRGQRMVAVSDKKVPAYVWAELWPLVLFTNERLEIRRGHVFDSNVFLHFVRRQVHGCLAVRGAILLTVPSTDEALGASHPPSVACDISRTKTVRVAGLHVLLLVWTEQRFQLKIRVRCVLEIVRICLIRRRSELWWCVEHTCLVAGEDPLVNCNPLFPSKEKEEKVKRQSEVEIQF